MPSKTVRGKGAIRYEVVGMLLRAVVTPDQVGTLQLLPLPQLREALGATNARDLVIAVAIDQEHRHVILYRGTLEPLMVPYSWFTEHQTGARPTFTDVTIRDYGQTVRLGKYEASVDAILYDWDAEYRQRANAREVMLDTSFGGSIRRLRLSRGIRRDAIPGVTEKAVARIERNEVQRPHRGTLRALAKAFGVAEEALGTY